MVARPRKIRKPKKSVVAVTKTAEDTAGSNFSFDRVNGVSTPTVAATSRFRIMAVAMTAPMRQSWNQKPAARPTRGESTRPLASPTVSSRQKVRAALEEVSSRVARARTVTVRACVPALPPMAETIGINTARATICWIVPSKKAMTPAPRMAVNRLMPSQGTRPRTISSTPDDRSSSETPARRRMSSRFSS
ncbi:hypothetical protein D3C85_1402270 [compost metagenome]